MTMVVSMPLIGGKDDEAPFTNKEVRNMKLEAAVIGGLMGIAGTLACKKLLKQKKVINKINIECSNNKKSKIKIGKIVVNDKEKLDTRFFGIETIKTIFQAGLTGVGGYAIAQYYNLKKDEKKTTSEHKLEKDSSKDQEKTV